ncbi:MAG: hypothetical protein OEM94_01415 [Acidimicrobiia bacterium]|nr:hypothetical protein [Acidimicrobiia bacterium]
MNVFDFTEALRRQRRFLVIGLVVVLLPIFLLSFTVSDGKPTFRIGPDYESTVQFAVAPAGVESLAQADLNPGDLTLPAGLYAELIKSDAFVDALFEQDGIRLTDDIKVELADAAPVISATFTTATRSEATAASLAAFEWLEGRLSDQLVVADAPVSPTTVAVIDVTRPFASRLDIEVATGLGLKPSDLFLIVDIGSGTEIAVPLARNAGSALEINTTLSPAMTVRLTLEQGGTRQDQPVRLTPPEMPDFADAVPALVMTIADSAILESEDSFRIRPGGIATAWEQGDAFVSTGTGGTRDVALVLLTPEPSANPIGTRRGPILLISALAVGMLLLLAVAISKDTWHQEKLAQMKVVAVGETDGEATGFAAPAGSARSVSASPARSNAARTVEPRVTGAPSAAARTIHEPDEHRLKAAQEKAAQEKAAQLQATRQKAAHQRAAQPQAIEPQRAAQKAEQKAQKAAQKAQKAAQKAEQKAVQEAERKAQKAEQKAVQEAVQEAAQKAAQQRAELQKAHEQKAQKQKAPKAGEPLPLTAAEALQQRDARPRAQAQASSGDQNAAQAEASTGRSTKASDKSDAASSNQKRHKRPEKAGSGSQDSTRSDGKGAAPSKERAGERQKTSTSSKAPTKPTVDGAAAENTPDSESQPAEGKQQQSSTSSSKRRS